MSVSDRFDARLAELTGKWEEEQNLEKKESKTIHDAIHGAIVIEDFLVNIVDLPPIQRLREIKQLGTAERLYPTANHTRFEHTLGTYAVARKILDEFERQKVDSLTETKRREVLAAAILHDIGHLPYSHTSEDYIRDESNIEVLLEDFKFESSIHEYIGYRLLQTEYFEKTIANINDEWGYGLGLDNIRNMIVGYARNPEHEYLADIISAAIDADRIDYLLRDSYKVGFPTVIDVERLYQTLTPVEDPESTEGRKRLGIKEKGIMAAESLFLARDRLKPTIHNHHLARVSETVLLREVKEAFDDRDPFGLIGLTDLDLHAILKENGTDRYPRYRNRQLPKRYAYYNTNNKKNQQRLADITLDQQLKLEDLLGARFDEPVITVIQGPDQNDKSGIGDTLVDKGGGESEEFVIDLSRKYNGASVESDASEIQVHVGWEALRQKPTEEELDEVLSLIAIELELEEEYFSVESKQKTYDSIL